jgi:two-component system chemotaxis response regulator CheY
MRVLIIDDSVVMQKIVESAIRNTGLEITAVLHAANGLEGLRTLQLTNDAQPIDLVLCDIHMPVMDGLGFLSELRRRNFPANFPVVMITADPSDPHLVQALANGAVGYISKPFTVDQMRDRIASLIVESGQLAGTLPSGSHATPSLGGAA